MDLYRIEAIEPGGFMEGEEIFLFEVILFRGYMPELTPPENFIVFRFKHSMGEVCECKEGAFRPCHVYDILECDSCGIQSPMKRIGTSWQWGHTIIHWP